MSVVVSFVTGSYLMNLPVLSPSKVARKNSLQAKFVTSRKESSQSQLQLFLSLVRQKKQQETCSRGQKLLLKL